MYTDKFNLAASYRIDGSSRFAENNKYGSFPSVSAAYRLGEEDFLKDLNWVEDVKIRASWGIVGNQAISPYQSLAAISSGANYPWNGSDQIDYGFQISQAINPKS